ncbi:MULTISPECIES: hypothetical protein [Rhizobium]|uniref:Conserved protein n=1 Tax=Rhizobium favelukesii TaxID=348824 RepID=W6RT45_9HYPH|nr:MULTISPECIES: hypothetical protein [Rhizobium]MCA0801599.1 hypothetical protein [Rhizobium sp. T1473]MCS0462812.1 hypothetical protein [Rhizobium favelukesii]UFS81007.1 hypothetical protein LPB79_22050 [Rhizobium sp. T136]CDM57451.1 putative conserved protein [Rhizobium favelukesii]
MRAQSKPFIVEIKSSRRTERRQSASIWGNLDLATVAEEIAEELPQPVAVPEEAAGAQ